MKCAKLAVASITAITLLSGNTYVYGGWFSSLKGSEAATESDIEITVCEEQFSSEKRAEFLIYETVADIGRQLGYVVQNNNPELSFEDDLQDIGICRLYLTYYGETTKEQARDTLETYTDNMITSLCDTFPNADFEIISVNWEVPAIEEENLYAASYWCEKEDGEIVRGEGSGKIYN